MGDEMNKLVKRLDRFEDELSMIRKAIVQMARTEERVSIILEQTTALFKINTETQKRLGDLEKENAVQGQSISFFERFGWIIAGIGASLATWWVTK